jgi:glycosyltransferase involved in cell wall biosynthesis
MNTPRITVVIPTYNRAHFLREAVESALAQTYRDFAIVIADNASTDGTAKVVAGFNDPRIYAYRHPTNIGMTANWQFVFSKVTTEFVAPLADDDHYLPDHLATALERLDRYPDVAYCTSPAEFFGGKTGSYRPWAITDTTTPLLYFAPHQAVDFLGMDVPGPMNSMVCRTRALGNLFWGKPDYITQDLLVMTQLMVQGGFIFSNRVTSRYRHHGANESSNHDPIKMLRLNCMAWYGARYLAQFLLDKGVCTLADIETHGLTARCERHVVPVVIGLGSFDSPSALRAVARRIFKARTDMDAISARFRLARRVGFVAIPLSERVSQFRCRWRP